MLNRKLRLNIKLYNKYANPMEKVKFKNSNRSHVTVPIYQRSKRYLFEWNVGFTRFKADCKKLNSGLTRLSNSVDKLIDSLKPFIKALKAASSSLNSHQTSFL